MVAVSFATEKRNLKERLVQIMTFKKKGIAAVSIMLALLVLLVGCVSAIGPANGSDDSVTPTDGAADAIYVDSVDSFLAALGQIFVCPMAAFAFAKMRFHGRRWIYGLLLMTLMIPVQVIIIPEYYLMMKLRWINSFLPLIVPSFLSGALGTFMFISVFEAIPTAMFDAAVIDGASAYKILWRVYFPQATASVATLFIIGFMNNWNDLLRPLLYLNKAKLYTVTIGLTRFQSEYTSSWGLLLTASVLSILPLIAVYIFCQRYIIENQMSSGVKG